VTTIADGSTLLSAAVTALAVNATVFKTLSTIWRRNSPGRIPRHHTVCADRQSAAADCATYGDVCLLFFTDG
jgi:hypothetical protein